MEQNRNSRERMSDDGVFINNTVELKDSIIRHVHSRLDLIACLYLLSIQSVGLDTLCSSIGAPKHLLKMTSHQHMNRCVNGFCQEINSRTKYIYINLLTLSDTSVHQEGAHKTFRWVTPPSWKYTLEIATLASRTQDRMQHPAPSQKRRQK